MDYCLVAAYWIEGENQHELTVWVVEDGEKLCAYERSRKTKESPACWPPAANERPSPSDNKNGEWFAHFERVLVFNVPNAGDSSPAKPCMVIDAAPDLRVLDKGDDSKGCLQLNASKNAQGVKLTLPVDGGLGLQDTNFWFWAYIQCDLIEQVPSVAPIVFSLSRPSLPESPTSAGEKLQLPISAWPAEDCFGFPRVMGINAKAESKSFGNIVTASSLDIWGRNRISFVRNLRLPDCPKKQFVDVGLSEFGGDQRFSVENRSGDPPKDDSGVDSVHHLQLCLEQPDWVFAGAQYYRLPLTDDDLPDNWVRAPWQLVLRGAQCNWNRQIVDPVIQGLLAAQGSRAASVLPYWSGDDPNGVCYKTTIDLFWLRGARFRNPKPENKWKLRFQSHEPVTTATPAETQIEFPLLGTLSGKPLAMPLRASPVFIARPKFGNYSDTTNKYSDAARGLRAIDVVLELGSNASSITEREICLGGVAIGFDSGTTQFLCFRYWLAQVQGGQCFPAVLTLETLESDETLAKDKPRGVTSGAVTLGLKSFAVVAQDEPSEVVWLEGERDPEFSAPPAMVIPLVAGTGNQVSLSLVATEDCRPGRGHKLELEISNSQGGEGGGVHLPDTLVLDPCPFSVVLAKGLALESDMRSNVIAKWVNGGPDGLAWRVKTLDRDYTLILPPQSVGETMIKTGNAEGINYSSTKWEKEALEYRLSPPARLTVSPDDRARNFDEPPWNLRRLLGGFSQRVPGLPLRRARFELLFGMKAELSAPGLRLSEQQSRWGALPGPLPSPPLWRAPDDSVHREIHKAWAKKWKKTYRRLQSRLAHHEVWSPSQLSGLHLDKGVGFEQRRRTDAETRSPVAEYDVLGNVDDLLEGGWAWGFESVNVYKAVTSSALSTSGEVRNILFSAMGASGSMRAGFDEDRSFIVAEASDGDTHSYSLERIGRIGVFWNRAKHVIVYQRAVQPANNIDTGMQWRAVLRKVDEYVEILQPERGFPDGSGEAMDLGFVQGLSFAGDGKVNPRIRVLSSWGADVGDEGWMVPLWMPAEEGYPKPDVHLQLAGMPDPGAPGNASPRYARIDNPQCLRFYTDTRPGTGANTDRWSVIEEVDYVDRPLVAVGAGATTHDPADPDAKLSPADLVAPGFESFTLLFAENAPAANVTHGRPASDATVPGAAVAARPRAVLMMRGRSARRLAAEGEARSGLERADKWLDKLLPGDKERLLPVAGGAALPDAFLQALAELAQQLNRERDSSSAQADFGSLVSLIGEINSWASWRDAFWPEFSKSACERYFELAESAVNQQLNRVQQEIETKTKTLIEANDNLSADARQALVDWRRRCDLVRTLTASPFSASLVVLNEAEQRINGAIEHVQALVLRIVGGVSASLSEAKKECAKDKAKLAQWVRAESAGLENRFQAILEALETIESAYLSALAKLSALGLSVKNDDTRKKVAEVISRAYTAVDGALKKSLKNLEELQNDSGIEKVLDDLDKSLNKARESVKSELGSLKDSATDSVTKIKKPLNEASVAAEDAVEACRTWLKAIDTAVEKHSKEAIEELSKAEKKATEKLEQIRGSVPDNFKAVKKGICAESAEPWASRLENAAKLPLAQKTALINELVGRYGQVYRDWSRQLGNKIGEIKGVAPEELARLKDSLRFHVPDVAITLPRAVVDAPRAMLQELNRARIALDFLPNVPRIAMTPAMALIDRIGRDLKPVGLRIPIDGIQGRLLTTPKLDVELSTLIGDLALRFNKLFPGIKPPTLPNDLSNDPRIKLSHREDLRTREVQIDVDMRIDFDKHKPIEVFNSAPVRVSLTKAVFCANVHAEGGGGKPMARRSSGQIKGDWTLGIGGTDVVVFKETVLTLDESGHFDFEVAPDRIELAAGLKFVMDVVRNWAKTQSDKLRKAGVEIEIVTEMGRPVGVQSFLRLPVPPLDGVTTGISGLNLSSTFGIGVLTVPGYANERKEFCIRAQLQLGRRDGPFTLTVFILGGAGWISVDVYYIPERQKVVTALDVSVGASARLGFNFGAVAGAVQIYLGVNAYLVAENGHANVSLALVISANGYATLCGIVTVGVYMALEARYQEPKLIGEGTFSASVELGPWWEIEVHEHVVYEF